MNGTCNYILSRMEAGADYATVLADAQQLGYAEADLLPMWTAMMRGPSSVFFRGLRCTLN